ncbi:MAG: hypothetical protein PHD13_01220 [Methanocellales archaeon]|nr:hypothetical protein [Methanocellales archaeon]MDD3292231.1 hypothetical protein [Methanocellales archaeon]MDD5234783.1 hypothetical protein [Methanocellales archaeon]MDD5484847.1 hypothetical protein [Methanocellales archaeon]
MAIGMETLVQIISSVIIAAATVTYATLTYFLLREQRTERNKKRFQEIADVLIRPLFEQLDAQKEYLKKVEVEWSRAILHQPPCLIYPQKLIGDWDLVNRKMKLVYSDFKEKSPKITEKIEKHDEAMEKLEESLNTLADKIKSLPDFEKKVSEQFEEYKRVTSSSDASHFEPTIENLVYILECIVSNKQDLGGDSVYRINVYQDFWNQNGKELLEIRERPEIKNYTIAVETSCKKLLELTDEILGDLEGVCKTYNNKYGISYETMEDRPKLEDLA